MNLSLSQSSESLMKALPEPVILLNVSDEALEAYECLYANPAMLEMLDLPLHEVQGTQLSDICPNLESVNVPLSEAIQKVLETGDIIKIGEPASMISSPEEPNYQLEVIRVAEEQVAIRVHPQPQIRHKLGDPKLLSQLLEHSQEVAGICAWMVDGETGGTVFSDAYLKIHHFTESEVTIENATELAVSRIHPEDAPQMEAFRTAQHENFPVVASYRFRIENNQYIWLEDTISAQFQDGTQIGITKDITEVRTREIDLQNLLNLKEKVLYTSPGIIYVYDLKNQKNVFANKSLFEKLGYTTEYVQELGDKFFERTVHQDDLDEVFNHHENVLPSLEDKEVVRLEYRMYSQKIGEYVWLESTESVFERDREGNVITIVGIARDKTDQKKAELSLRETNQELEQLVYSVSHDLRSPVRHIASYAQLVRKAEGRLSPKGEEWLDNVICSASRLGGMIDELLAYAISRKSTPNKTWIRSEELVLLILHRFQESHPSQPINWEIIPLPTCYADPEMFARIWENLISNAVKYSSKKPETRIKIEAEQGQTHIRFAIHDNGCGFDKQYSNKLFNVFQRLHEHTDFEGHGIGLANVERMVQLHGGRVWATSKVGQGASFFFTIPIVNQPIDRQELAHSER